MATHDDDDDLAAVRGREGGEWGGGEGSHRIAHQEGAMCCQ